MNRQRLLLVILVPVLIATSLWSYYSFPRQKTVAKLTYAPGGRAVATRERAKTDRQRANPIDSRILRLDLLENRPVSAGYQRNIFSPLFVDEETMLERQAAAAAAAAAAEAARRARLAVPPQPVKPLPVPTGVQTELAAFKLHGFLKKDGKKIIFLAKGQDITPVKEGTTFAGRYVATSITDQVIILKVTGTGEEIVIPLIENEPLRAMR
ncbi:MAG: type II secretion system protein PulP [Deltaproteobacteria bacterium]|nr:type II secretion system protein PulP [Deltaproteobacteria bacterium]TLN02216.1 MAG: type II secretion system protein PulP [bacterium]